MAIPITVPRLGWTMEQGVFVGWLKADGDSVRAGEALFALESEKATEEIEGFDDGVLHIPAGGPRKGETIAVGAVIGYVLLPGEAAPTANELSAAPRPRETSAVGTGSPAGLAPSLPGTPGGEGRGEGGRNPSRNLDFLAGAGPSPPPPLPRCTGGEGRLIPAARPASSPRARRAAARLGIDLGHVQGTGRTGRIRERDVLARAASPSDPSALGGESSMRRVIAERMLNSHRSTAPVTLMTTIDATHLADVRARWKNSREGGDFVPTYTDLFVKLAALALERHPVFNARWEDQRIVAQDGIHIGIAVDTEAGLVVPVLRGVPGLSIGELAHRSRDLVERARKRQLSASEMQGGTFTVTSLGALGIDAFTPIIHYPECAILGVGRIRRCPVVAGDQIVIGDQVTLSLTFDHRIADGAPAARFLQTLAAHAETLDRG
jgi:pyruvate dehydrogenase E2 component (dihydrolipoamide acetyltransferase)